MRDCPNGTLREAAIAWLAQNVPESRIQHILRVEQMAMELAHHHHLDEQKAGQAGLLHDLAKFFKPQRLLEMAQQANLLIDPVDKLNPHLLHAEVSALVAAQEFEISDPEILSAIANHTLGQPGMSPLSCVVFLADSLEPGRGDTPELEQLRQACWENLTQAMWLTCDYSIRYLLETRRSIHPRTILTRNWFLRQSSLENKQSAGIAPNPVSA